MANKIAIDSVRDKFLLEIDSAANLVNSINALPRWSPRATQRGIHPSHVYQVAELAFMGLVAAWEEFLEDTLVRYVAGATTKSGFQPTPKVKLPTKIDRAYAYLAKKTGYNRATDYLKVTNYNWVVTVAGNNFSNHTYGHITPYLPLLMHATKIRNRVAHSSTKCRAEFKATALALRAGNGVKLPQSFRVGKLMFEIIPGHFPQASVQKQLTFFNAYADLYKELAKQIVP